MEGDTGKSDAVVRARLRTALEPAHGTGIRSTAGGNNNLAPGIQHSQRKRDHDAMGTLPSNRERVEGNKISVITDSDEDGDFSIPSPPFKRTRLTGTVNSHPTTDPSTQHTAPHESALVPRQIPSANQQRQPSASQLTPTLPAQDSDEQSREILRILTYQADAYFDILSLANGTDRLSLVETSWLDLSYLVHPRRCSLPRAVEALSRVNDAYSWIQKHPGLRQPHAPASPPPRFAEDAPSAQKAGLTPATPRKCTIDEDHQPRTSSGIQPQLTQQQPESHRATALPIFRGHAIEVPRQARNNPSTSTQPQPGPQRSESQPTRRLNPPSPVGHIVKKEPEARDKSGVRTQPAQQQSESRPNRKIAQLNPSGHAIKEEPQSPEIPSTQAQPAPHPPVSSDSLPNIPPPSWTTPARPSFPIYVTNGWPTPRPTVGWQFRKKLGGETLVWWDRRWRPLIQNREDFEGLDVDEDGWIVPIIRHGISDIKLRRIRSQAMFEFNTHP